MAEGVDLRIVHVDRHGPTILPGANSWRHSVTSTRASPCATPRTPQEPPPFPVLLGLWALYVVRAELDRALELAVRLRAIAEGSQDRLMRLKAHHTLWATHFYRGNRGTRVR